MRGLVGRVANTKDIEEIINVLVGSDWLEEVAAYGIQTQYSVDFEPHLTYGNAFLVFQYNRNPLVQ